MLDTIDEIRMTLSGLKDQAAFYEEILAVLIEESKCACRNRGHKRSDKGYIRVLVNYNMATQGGAVDANTSKP